MFAKYASRPLAMAAFDRPTCLDPAAGRDGHRRCRPAAARARRRLAEALLAPRRSPGWRAWARAGLLGGRRDGRESSSGSITARKRAAARFDHRRPPPTSAAMVQTRVLPGDDGRHPQAARYPRRRASRLPDPVYGSGRMRSTPRRWRAFAARISQASTPSSPPADARGASLCGRGRRRDPRVALLAARLWPRLTVSYAAPRSPASRPAETVGLRVPDHPWLGGYRRRRRPIAAPSANRRPRELPAPKRRGPLGGGSIV
jgi:hypothetical protein